MISKNEGPLAKVIYTGIALVVIGIICFMTGLLMSMVIGGMFFAVLPGIGMGLGVLGLAITLFAILFGLKKESSSYSKTPVRVPNCKITARFFINRNGEELFNESYLLEDEAPPKLLHPPANARREILGVKVPCRNLAVLRRRNERYRNHSRRLVRQV